MPPLLLLCPPPACPAGARCPGSPAPRPGSSGAAGAAHGGAVQCPGRALAGAQRRGRRGALWRWRTLPPHPADSQRRGGQAAPCLWSGEWVGACREPLPWQACRRASSPSHSPLHRPFTDWVCSALQVRQALLDGRSPEFLVEDEKRREARADSQGALPLPAAACCRGRVLAAHPCRRRALPCRALPCSCMLMAALSSQHSKHVTTLAPDLNCCTCLLAGGRWLDEGNMPRGAPTQQEQPEVQAALAAASAPQAQASNCHVCGEASLQHPCGFSRPKKMHACCAECWFPACLLGPTHHLPVPAIVPPCLPCRQRRRRSGRRAPRRRAAVGWSEPAGASLRLWLPQQATQWLHIVH